MSVLPLTLISLALAAGSDGESSGEKTWEERFDALDAARREFFVPPLSAEERMRVLLGELPNNKEYVVSAEYVSSGWYGIVLHPMEQKRKSRLSQVQKSPWAWGRFAGHVEFHVLYHSRWIEELSKRLFLPAREDLRVGSPCSKG
jgi:hypothetical protein